MNRVIIVHRWDGTPTSDWYPSVAKTLRAKGFEVSIPKMPNTIEPEIDAWIQTLVQTVGKPDKNTYFIGHSIGCQTILRYLEGLEKNKEVGGVIFVAPWMHLDEETIREEGEENIAIAKPWIETPIEFKNVINHTKNFIAIFSDNDPFVPVSDAKIFEEKLGAKIMIFKDMGHFDSSKGVNELPIVLKEMLRFLK